MPPTRSKCSVCRHDAAAEINAALSIGYSYRWIVERYGLSLGAISRHAGHRGGESTSADGQSNGLERRVGQLEEDVAMLRLVVGTELLVAANVREELAELDCQEDDGIPF